MNAVFIISLILLAGLVVFALCKLGTLESRIDDIYNKSFTMQGEIEANTARSQDNYKLIAQVNTELENVKNTIYRKQGMDIKSAGVAVGVSYSTAKRYEQWRKDNKK